MADPVLTLSIFAVLSFMFAFTPVLISRFMRPMIKDKQESIPYECGEIPVGSARNLGFGYYTYAVIYLVFEVASVFILLLAVSLYSAINVFTIGIMGSLSGVLFISLAYFYRQVRKIEV